ncbi:MAG: DUF4192 domain-containing protein [Nocardioides sp.]|nr:DUF4192 domain-containing protein [Nocardioides sp.]
MAKLTARCPDDLLAFVPVALGFVPEQSIAMLTFGPGPGFHARVDLPTDPADTDLVVEALVEPCLRHDVDRVVLVLYADGPGAVREVADRLESGFAREGIVVFEMMCADGQRWFPMQSGRPPDLYDGVPYDVSIHPFAAEAVVAGLVTHASRGDLAATLAPDPAAVAGVKAALGDIVPAQGSWVRRLTRRHARDGTVPDTADLARLLVSITDPVVREAAWCAISRAESRSHAVLWTAVLRAAPPGLVVGPAAVLAFACWLAGHGALAWCAVDRALTADCDCSLAETVSGLLVAAVSPAQWQPPGWPPPGCDEAHASGGAA